MPLFQYTDNIPFATNAPATDQPNMLTNTNSTDGILNVDHYSFNQTNGGLHKQSTYPIQSKPTIAAGQAAIYANTSGQSQLFVTSDAPAAGNQIYQLTRMVDAQIAKFGTFTAAGTVTANYAQTAGWTFLPGGFLFQYAQVRSTLGTPQISPSDIAVTYPVPFTSANVIVTITPISKATGSLGNNTASIRDGSVSNLGFTCKFQTSTSEYVGFTWTAMGI